MALDDTRMNEIVGLLEEWAKDNDIPPADLLNIYKTFKSAKDGQITWTKDDQEFGDLLFSIMEKALKK
jgi:hypothetical protein